MTNPQVLALVVGFGVACLARATAAQDPPTGSQAALDPTVLSRLDTALEQAVADREVSGVIGLIHHRGTRAYFKAFGWQDIETHKPLEKDAIFRLQSMTKPVVVATALALVDEGLMTLDEPIADHCPEWRDPTVLEDGRLVPARFAILTGHPTWRAPTWDSWPEPRCLTDCGRCCRGCGRPTPDPPKVRRW